VVHEQASQGVSRSDLSIHGFLSDQPLSVLKGHKDRIGRVAFHPSGNYVASASFDTTWRLWDINSSKELLLQEGHSKEVFTIEFQHDGALIVSGYAVLI